MQVREQIGADAQRFHGPAECVRVVCCFQGLQGGQAFGLEGGDGVGRGAARCGPDRCGLVAFVGLGFVDLLPQHLQLDLAEGLRIEGLQHRLQPRLQPAELPALDVEHEGVVALGMCRGAPPGQERRRRGPLQRSRHLPAGGGSVQQDPVLLGQLAQGDADVQRLRLELAEHSQQRAAIGLGIAQRRLIQVRAALRFGLRDPALPASQQDMQPVRPCHQLRACWLHRCALQRWGIARLNCSSGLRDYPTRSRACRAIFPVRARGRSARCRGP